MKIGFDAHMVGRRETGNETYALGLLEGLKDIGCPVIAYSLAPLSGRFHTNRLIRPSNSLIRIPLSMPLATMLDSLDLYHATYVLPPLLPCPSVVTVHDVSFALHPEWFQPRVRTILAALVPRALHKAARIITISNQTKRDLVELYGVDPDKVAITYLAPRPAFSSPVQRIEADKPFFLYVGNIEPRKNVGMAIEALRVLRDRGRDCSLVVAGKPGFLGAEAQDKARRAGLENWVRFAGYVSDSDLRGLFSTCLALVHPAWYEGFGLTPLEAMSQGVPVISSSASSLPEVVANAAILIDPGDAEEWADAMERVVDSRDLREELSRKGLHQASLFSWKRCAAETLQVYESILL